MIKLFSAPFPKCRCITFCMLMIVIKAFVFSGRQFVLGTFIGEIPASIVAVKAGCILSQLNSVSDLYDLETVLTISVIAILALVPIVFKRRIQEQVQGLTLIKTT